MKKLIYATMISSVFFGCKPEEQGTNFNTLIGVPVGEDMRLQMQEDQELAIEYIIPENEESIDLKVAIHKKPTNGILTSCSTPEVGKVRCLYKPNKDFYGSDTFQVIGKDGDVVAEKPSTVKIDIINVPDAPTALDDSLTIGSKQELVITFPEGDDPDSLTTELSYELVNGPQNGEITECLGRTCKYISDSLFDGQDEITYKVKDNTGLESNIGTIDINVNRVTFNTNETFNGQNDSLVGVDIVWVIDNSGSMEQEQAALRANFGAFINNFLVNGKARFKFNMAVTTSEKYRNEFAGQNPFEVDQAGNQYDLSSNKAELNFNGFRDDFLAATNVGIQGSGAERMLQSAFTAYNRNPNWHAGNNHMLAYILLTDEPEQSDNKTIQEHIADFQALKDKPEKVKFFNIINLNADNNGRFAALANASGTQVYNITASFGDILDNISLEVANAIKGYELNKNVAIIPETVKVFINGQPTTEFTFDAQANSVTLTNPPRGAYTIVVNYDYGVL